MKHISYFETFFLFRLIITDILGFFGLKTTLYHVPSDFVVLGITEEHGANAY